MKQTIQSSQEVRMHCGNSYCQKSMVYTSYKSEGEPGFAFPEGFPEGEARGKSRGEGKPRLSRALVGGISFSLIVS